MIATMNPCSLYKMPYGLLLAGFLIAVDVSSLIAQETEAATSAKVPPAGPVPIYAEWWAWVLAALVVIGLLGLASRSKSAA